MGVKDVNIKKITFIDCRFCEFEEKIMVVFKPDLHITIMFLRKTDEKLKFIYFDPNVTWI